MVKSLLNNPINHGSFRITFFSAKAGVIMIADDFFEQMIEMTELRQQMHRRPVLEGCKCVRAVRGQGIDNILQSNLINHSTWMHTFYYIINCFLGIQVEPQSNYGEVVLGNSFDDLFAGCAQIALPTCPQRLEAMVVTSGVTQP